MMRWSLLVLGVLGCDGSVCPPGAHGVLTGDGSLSCATRGEPCGRAIACSVGLTCVPTMLCAVGPCPGLCLEACSDDDECRDDELCEATVFDETETVCITGEAGASGPRS